MRIVFMGSGAFGCDTLRWLAGSRHDIVQVITQPARPFGRGRKQLHPTPVAELCNELNLPVMECADVNTSEAIEVIRNAQPDIIMVIAFGQKISDPVIEIPKERIINLHSSLLPKYRGAAPINWAIINGEKTTGVTIIEINQIWDGGRILGKSEIEIQQYETAGELHDRLAKLGPALMESVLDNIQNGYDHPIIQDDSKTCRAPKLKKTDGAIHWHNSAESIINLIYGMLPWPGTYCHLKQEHANKTERVMILHAELVSKDTPPADKNLEPGTLNDDLNIVCDPGLIKLTELRPENSKAMPFKAFSNGRHIQPGDRFLNG